MCHPDSPCQHQKLSMRSFSLRWTLCSLFQRTVLCSCRMTRNFSFTPSTSRFGFIFAMVAYSFMAYYLPPLNRQATIGPNNTKKPGFLNLVAKMKWCVVSAVPTYMLFGFLHVNCHKRHHVLHMLRRESWKRLGRLSKTNAKQRYLGEFRKVISCIPLFLRLWLLLTANIGLGAL